jgi:hypothetical protein
LLAWWSLLASALKVLDVLQQTLELSVFELLEV